MNVETSPSPSTERPGRKRRIASIPFLIVVLLFGVAGAYWGETIMTYCFLLQEKWKAHQVITEAIAAHENRPPDFQSSPDELGSGDNQEGRRRGKRGSRPAGEFEDDASQPADSAKTDADSQKGDVPTSEQATAPEQPKSETKSEPQPDK